MQEIIQLKVSLLHSKPLIWRQLQVHGDTSFFELHHILQISMGWRNYHFFEFNLEGYRMGKVEEEMSDGYGSNELMEARDVALKDLITHPQEVISYLYDFGDGWKHQITVEQWLPKDATANYPACIAGEMNCPPEDCGGIGSFYHYLDILKDKQHPEHKETARWMGKTYNPERFDKERVNRQLSKLDQYIQKWLSGGY